jgi:hypothetical protein
MPFMNIRLYAGHGKERKDWYVAGNPGKAVQR